MRAGALVAFVVGFALPLAAVVGPTVAVSSTAHAGKAKPKAGKRPRGKKPAASARRLRAEALYQQAEAHKQRAIELEKGGDAAGAHAEYDRAARAYSESYELVEHPALLFNVGQMHRLHGDKRRALETYRLYLETARDREGIALARRFVEELTDELAADEARDRAPPPPEATPAPPPDPRVIPPVARDSERGPGRGLRIAGLSIGAVGIVAVGVGVKYGRDASAASDELAGRVGAWRDDDETRFETAESAQRKMFVFYGVGGAALIVGGVLYVLGGRAAGRAGDRVTVHPVIGADRIAVGASLAF